LARNFAAKLKGELEAKDNLLLFGETFSYSKIMLGKITAEQEYNTVEEYLDLRNTQTTMVTSVGQISV